ncbi:uncharacterized protein LOC104441972 isoform X1 [Eucalyptus grandis]|uniref:uncharacterized protein LOC104441972 isoform X1 n=1 Tax=Eucalyptus grandis TaxID=71139 RepID=UPI00192E7842|nr:uncharacterized protein LOC104441972 isoform X1 [Eucalyptus grandis]
MHHKESELLIGKDSAGLSSDSGNAHQQSSGPHQQEIAGLAPDHHHHPHLSIQIPPASETHLDDEGARGNSPSTSQKTNLSTPHKRPIMTQSPLAFCRSSSHSPVAGRHPHQGLFGSGSGSARFSCFGSLAGPFGTRKFASCKFCHQLCRVRLLGVHLRFLVLILVPVLYFFASSPNRSFLLELISVVSFSATLLISLNLAIPRFPSIRLLFSRSFPAKIAPFSASKPARPVVWSIGPKPKVEKRATSGSWVQVYRNGDVYEGEFHGGKCSGSGVYYYYRSGRYEGDWVDGKYDGYGVETWAKGSRYRGQYRQGLRHGVGVYRFYTGDVYAGEWYNGQCHGCGEHTCEDGSKYAGEFKWGVKHGLGRYHFRNGDTYSGEYFADKMHGFGVYLFGNGHRYEGAWHEGIRQGFGMYSFRSGETQCGHWHKGVLDPPGSPSFAGGPNSSSNMHSKVLNAVQEARRASERAHEVGKVDERVNRAIAFANKSANAARVAAVKAVQNQVYQDHTPGDRALPVLIS